ncbi:MAG: efflux transporter outer membrane subunit, partial [Desulfobulbaceae bacterium]|nr:efflux transporter outer membrane subunit [Desulfobulbaceae bacterium]
MRTPQPFHPAAAGRLRPVALLLVLLAATACAPVGPNYSPPEPRAPASWHTGLAEGLSGESPAALARWWDTFNDPVLSALIDQAMAGNLDLQLAQARLHESRARLGATEAEAFPDLTGNASASRGRSHGQTQNLFATGFDAGWEADIFGGLRRAREAARADLAAGEEERREVLVSLLAEVASNYLEARTFQGRLSAATENIALQADTLQLADWRRQAGLSDELAVQQARYNLAATRAQLPGLRSGLAGSLNRLTVLTGTRPGQIQEMLQAVAPIPAPPATVLVGVPAETLRQRPDLRRAEQQLAAATARIGVAIADLYPKFRLSGTLGVESVDSADILAAASRSWRLGPSFSWPLFDGGRIRRNIEAQSAQQEQQLIAYQSVVLTALAEVEDALTAYVEEQRRQQALGEAAQ